MAFLPKYAEVQSALKHVELKDNRLLKIAVGAAAIVLVALMFPRGEALEYEYAVGGVWVDADLISPFSFPIYKDEARYKQEKQLATAKVLPVFDRNDKVFSAVKESLKTLVGKLNTAATARDTWQRHHRSADSLAFVERVKLLPFLLRDNQWYVIGRLLRTGPAEFSQALTEFLETTLVSGVADNGTALKVHASIAVRRGTEEEILSSETVRDIESGSEYLELRAFRRYGENDTGAVAVKILHTVLKPNILYNPAETEKLIQIAIDNVPRTVGYVQDSEKIVGKHERITEEVKLKLDSLLKAKADRGTKHSQWWQFLGIFLHVMLVLSLYTLYLVLFRKKIFHNNAQLILIAILILIECFFAWLSLEVEVKAPLQYLIFVPAASMLLTIIFDSRVAFYGTVTIAFLIAGIRGNDYSIALASLVAGALSVYTVRDIKHRTQIFRSLIFIFLGYALVIIALGLERFAAPRSLVTELTFALSNAVFSPMLTYGLLIFFERVFKVTTDLTLLELSDFNHPLLRKLSEVAPGTFHHSITLGSIAESAAEAIGANAILARVGAYYHDIGKSLKPEYFVENQRAGKNKHGRLSPRMSALIIASHVKEGVEHGRQYGLPPEVLDFIPQHHGTTRISFFYDKALKQAAEKKNSKSQVREEDYRYPGPKPQTKEAGIIMLADSADATARVLENPTPPRLEELIDNLMKSRFMEGQLDECELTLRDLSKIKEAFLKILVGIHHARIKYPEPEPTLGDTIEKPISEQEAPKVSIQTDEEEQQPEEPNRRSAAAD